MIWIITSTLLVFLSFPNFLSYEGYGILGWISLVPFLYVLSGKKLVSCILLGMCFGGLVFLAIIFWMSSVNLSGYFLFVLALAIQPILFSILYQKISPNEWLNAIYIAGAWVISEFVRSLIFGGFTWSFAYSQSFFPIMIQWASIFGTYGIIFVMVAVNYFLLLGITKKKIYFVHVAVVMIIFISTGSFLLQKNVENNHQQISITTIQGNIANGLFQEKDQRSVIEEKYVLLTEKSLAQQADLIVWPETVFIHDFITDITLNEKLNMRTQSWNAPLLFGTVSSFDQHYFNSALFLSPAGYIEQMYHKQKLIPFSESIPKWAGSFDLTRQMNLSGYDFSAGKNQSVMYLRLQSNQLIPFGVAICSESMYSALYQQMIHHDAAFAVTLLNNGWFKDKQALMMHMQADIFRAVEMGLPIVRSANTGASAYIDQKGRVLMNKDMLMKEWVNTFKVGLRTEATFYSKNGDILAWGALIFVILINIISAIKYFIFRKPS